MRILGFRRPVIALVAVMVMALGLSTLSSAMPRLGSVERWAARDPGARFGGNTIIATGSGGTVLGVPDRPNFILALGTRETVLSNKHNDTPLLALGTGDPLVAPFGNQIHDQIRALGTDVTVLLRSGDDFVLAGRGGTVVATGPGHDLIEAASPDTTIKVESPWDEVLVSGRDDQVMCSARAADEVIIAGRTDNVSKTCRGHHDRVLKSSRSTAQDNSPPRASVSDHVGPLLGRGTNTDPYTYRDCVAAYFAYCYVYFPDRTLDGLWANEYVPAYRCPSTYPYLGNIPGGDSKDHPRREHFDNKHQWLPNGVVVDRSYYIAISITHTILDNINTTRRAVGTATGYPNSSVTNWGTGKSSYHIFLACTNDPKDSYHF